MTQAMKHSSNDVKQLSAQIVILLSRTAASQQTELTAHSPGLTADINSLHHIFYQLSCRHFGSLCCFPVNDSCLSLDVATVNKLL